MNYLLFTFLGIGLILASCANKGDALQNQAVAGVDTVRIKTDPMDEHSVNSVPPPFRLHISEHSNWHVKIDTITMEEFDHTQLVQYKKSQINRDSLLKAVSVTSKRTVILTDSCCLLKGWDKDLEVCNKKSTDQDEMDGTQYEAVSFDHGYLIVMEAGYEYDYHLIFNPVTRKYVSMSNLPRYLGGDRFYAAGEGYGNSEFQIADLATNKYYSFELMDWQIRSSYYKDNSIFLEINHFSGNFPKYLRASFE